MIQRVFNGRRAFHVGLAAPQVARGVQEPAHRAHRVLHRDAHDRPGLLRGDEPNEQTLVEIIDVRVDVSHPQAQTLQQVHDPSR
jgi:hypothetical protein